MGSIRKKLVRSLFRTCIRGSLAIFTLIGGVQTALAQITPDAATTVEVILGSGSHAEANAPLEPSAQFNIDGGLRSQDNTNLFHGFEQFDLRAGQTANFITPPGLENVIGHISGSASSIDGLLQVLGSRADLYLINPSGILFGPNARLNLPGSFTATTATDIGFENDWLNLLQDSQQKADYSALSGRPTAFGFAASGPIVNLGDLTLGAGRSLSLMGSQVINTGRLSAPEGTITIMAVEQGSLLRIGQGNQLLSLEVSPEDSSGDFNPATLSELLTGGSVSHADKLRVNGDGTVSLIGPDIVVPEVSGTTIVSGKLAAEGRLGGEINIFGTQVGLLESQLSASGERGGGTLRLGGDYQGSSLAPTAQRTYVGPRATLSADAFTDGEGGQVYVWSDKTTQFYGGISAKGGQSSGSGGFVEISGRLNLDYEGTVDLSAAQGAAGTLLFDPLSILIKSGSGIDTPTSESFPNLFSTDFRQFTLYEETLEQFDSVIFQAYHDITIEPLADGELTFQPGGTILFQVDIDNNGGHFRMDPADTIRAAGGSVKIISGDSSDRSLEVGTIDTSSEIGEITTSHIELISNGLVSAHSLNAGEGNITISGNGVSFRGGPGQVSGNRVELYPHRPDANINIGERSTIRDTLNLSLNDIRALSDDISQIVIGRTDGSGQITLSADIADSTGNGFTRPVILQGNRTNPELVKLVGPNAETEWTITELNRGTLSDFSQITFIDIANIASGDHNDTFVFAEENAYIQQSIQDESGDLTLLGDHIRLPMTLQGNGHLSIYPASSGIDIELGGQGGEESDRLYITSDDIAGIQPTFSGIEIGSTETGSIILRDTIPVPFPLTLRAGGRIDTTIGELANTGENSSISFIAGDDIKTGGLVTKDGDITLVSPTNITTTYLDAGGGDASGDITVTAGGYVSVRESIPESENEASISTGSNGEINITHGGNGSVPFSVGNAAQAPNDSPPNNPLRNGTFGRITNQIVTLIDRMIFGNFSEDQLSITTEASEIPPPPQTPDSPPAVRAPIVEDRSDGQGLGVVLVDSESEDAERVFSRIETAVGRQFEDYLSIEGRASKVATLNEVQRTLALAKQNLSVRSALVYVYFVSEVAPEPVPEAKADSNSPGHTPSEDSPNGHPEDRLEVMMITADGSPQKHRLWGVTRADVEVAAAELRYQATSQFSRPQEYLPPAQQLYNWMIRPLQHEMENQQIDNIAFIMDDGLRTMPIAALHDGEQFLLETHSLALMPTFSLTSLTPEAHQPSHAQSNQVLAMGASRFEQQPPLPAVEAELDLVSKELGEGQIFLNENFTLENLRRQVATERYRTIHLATHAVFEAGDQDNSYIQLWDDRITLPEVKALGLAEAGIDLIILSACNTALGDRYSEYGFAGFAVNAGSQSALASLWPVSDEGTLGFMTQFYKQYAAGATRSEALRQAQLNMLNGQVSIRNGEVRGPNNEVLATIDQLAESGYWDFSHPFYWSAFTMIGNPW
ncbi:MAG: CHAT domain-containing protein [Cyanobacteria bacterium J06626_6]